MFECQRVVILVTKEDDSQWNVGRPSFQHPLWVMRIGENDTNFNRDQLLSMWSKPRTAVEEYRQPIHRWWSQWVCRPNRHPGEHGYQGNDLRIKIGKRWSFEIPYGFSNIWCFFYMFYVGKMMKMMNQWRSRGSDRPSPRIWWPSSPASWLARWRRMLSENTHSRRWTVTHVDI